MFKHNKNGIIKAIIISMVINVIIITLYIIFVFGMKKDIFVINEDVLDNQMVAYLETLSNRLDYYDNKMNKIINSYSFIDFVDESMTNGIDDDEVKKIVELFIGIEKPFSSVSLHGKDGELIFSRPVRMHSGDIPNNIKVKDSSIIFTSYKDIYDGIEFTVALKDIDNNFLGYVSASVDKAIFSDIVENSQILLLPNGIIYYSNNTDISKTSKEKLISLLNNTSEESSYFAKIDDTGLLFYASLLNRILGFNIGFIVDDIVPLQQYFKYIILVVLLLSLIFLTCILVSELIKKRSEFLDDDVKPSSNNDSDLPIKNILNKEAQPKTSLNAEQDETSYFDSLDLGSNIDEFLLEDKVVDEEEIIKEEGDYFSSKEAFNVSLDDNFLSEQLGDKNDSLLSDNDEDINAYVDELLDKSNNLSTDDDKAIDDEVETNEVPKIPDDYYSDNEDNAKTIEEEYEILLNSIKNEKFIEKDMAYMLDYVRNYFNFKIDIMLMLGYNSDEGKYVVTDSENISSTTQELFKIGERENIFSKLLVAGKPVDIKNPYSSKALSLKFDSNDIDGITKMLFIPVENTEGRIASFFIIGLKGL